MLPRAICLPRGLRDLQPAGLRALIRSLRTIHRRILLALRPPIANPNLDLLFPAIQHLISPSIFCRAPSCRKTAALSLSPYQR